MSKKSGQLPKCRLAVSVQRAAAGALRTLAFKNEENKNMIVEGGALPTLVQMLKSDDPGEFSFVPFFFPLKFSGVG